MHEANIGILIFVGVVIIGVLFFKGVDMADDYFYNKWKEKNDKA